MENAERHMEGRKSQGMSKDKGRQGGTRSYHTGLQYFLAVRSRARVISSIGNTGPITDLQDMNLTA